MVFEFTRRRRRTLFGAILTATVLLFAAAFTQASGMRPSTSVILIDESIGETSVSVTNTENVVNLLASVVYNLPGDDEEIVVLTPPLARVEAGESQLVRFILQLDKPLTTQRLRRVKFEGLADRSTSNEMAMTISQDLAVLISPKGLKEDLEPWKHITWALNNHKLVASNPSSYVVRLSLGVELLPGAVKISLPHTYILPGQTISMDVPANVTARSVKIYPANLYGFAVDGFTAPIE